MAAASSSTKLIALRRLLLLPTTLRPISPLYSSSISRSLLSPLCFLEPSNYSTPPLSRTFSSSGPSGIDSDASTGPVAVDYSSLLQEDEFHNLADSTINHLLEKIEEYGDSVEIDGFDIDYGNQVLTVKFGDLGIYVLNKQTPNRQIWMSSPVSGPSRFDWDQNAQAWVYRRTKEYLFKILESELTQLCGHAISLS